MNILSLIGRKSELFNEDVSKNSLHLQRLVESSRFLVIGGSGSIGVAVTREIFKRDPIALHVVDISENNMVELVRDLRSSVGYGSGEFKTFSVLKLALVDFANNLISSIKLLFKRIGSNPRLFNPSLETSRSFLANSFLGFFK